MKKSLLILLFALTASLLYSQNGFDGFLKPIPNPTTNPNYQKQITSNQKIKTKKWKHIVTQHAFKIDENTRADALINKLIIYD